MTDKVDPWEDPLFCAVHYKPEPAGYLRCGECWHSFATEDELLDEDAKWRGHRLTKGEDVFSCPVCIHDF